MKKILLILLFTTAWMQGQTLQNPTYNKTTTNDLTAKSSIKVDVNVVNSSFISPNLPSDLQQGYAFDGTNHYIIGTSKISKRDASWNVIIDNNSALTGITGVNHLGDGVYLGGFLYIPVETYPAVTGMKIAKYDATTLALVTTYDISAQGHEASSITTDGTILYISSYDDGSKIWKYSLTGSYLGNISITNPFTNGIQGISYYLGDFYISEQTRISKLNISGTVNTFIGYSPGSFGNSHRAEGVEVVSGIVRLLVLGLSNNNIYYLTNATTRTNVFNVDSDGRTSITSDFIKKAKTFNTEYGSIGIGELVLGNRAGGTAALIANRTNSTTTTGLFLLGIQNTDITRTLDSDMVFRVGSETGDGIINTLNTSGLAYAFSNGGNNLYSISRQGNHTITGLSNTDGFRIAVGGTINALSGVSRGIVMTTNHVATANNNVLAAIDLLPTFNNVAFTGVEDIGIRLSGSFNTSHATLLTNTLTTGQSTWSAKDDTGNKFMDVGVANSAITTGASWGLAGESFLRSSGNSNGLHVSAAGATAPIRFSTNNGSEKMRVFGASGNVVIQTAGTFTDNGVDKLQVTGTASGTVDATVSNQFVRKGQLDVKADLASPIFTGNPTVPNQTAGDNDTSAANTAFVTGAIVTADSNNVKITGNQTIDGIKSFNASTINPSIDVYKSSSSGSGVRIQTNFASAGGTLLEVNSTNANAGTNVAKLLVLNAGSLSTGTPLTVQNSGTDTFTVDKLGNVTTSQSVTAQLLNISAGALYFQANAGGIAPNIPLLTRGGDRLRLVSSITNTNTAELNTDLLGAARSYSFPDASGTLALVSNLPTSGSYTPTITNVSNTSTLSVTDATYTKIGNIVTARISISVTATLIGASSCTFSVTLPVNRVSTTSVSMGDGSLQDNGSGTITAVKTGSTSTSAVNCIFTSTALNAYTGAVVIQYSVL